MPTTPRAPSDDGRPAGRPFRRARRWWRDASVRRKFVTTTAVGMLACLPPAALAVRLELRVADLRASSRATEDLARKVQSVEDQLIAADGAMRYFAIQGFDEPQHVVDYEAATGRIPPLIADLERELPAGLADELRDTVTSIDAQLLELDAIINYQTTTPNLDNPTNEDVATKREPSLLDKLLASTRTLEDSRRSIAALSAGLDERLRIERSEMERLEQNLARSVIVSWIVALGAVVGGIVAVTGGIVRRIELVSQNGQRFLRGEPLLPVARSADEIGQLTDGMKIVGELLDQRRRQAVAATLARDEFLSRVSHELRTPLTGIIGFAQILEDEDLEPEHHRFAERIANAGEHLLNLINDLLDTAKIESGHLSMTLEPVALSEVVDQAVALVGSLAADRSITLDSDCPDDLSVVADRQRLGQVLLNLLSNAIKYNRHAGRVDVVARVHDDAVRISVTDTGPGIPPEGLEQLFRPFERLDAPGDVEGSGIGLALTKTLVNAMEGTIGVESEVGTGTTFWVDLTPAPSSVLTPTAAEPT